MKKLPLPKFNITQVLEIHKKSSSKALSKNIDKLTRKLPLQEIIYKDYALQGKLCDLVPTNNRLFKGLTEFYDNTFVKNKSLRENCYDILKLSLQGNTCPYCVLIAHEIQIDHYLPKSIFWEFAILPINLIPCCSSCNKKKLDSFTHGIQEIIHPYFDDYSNEQWLFAEIANIDPFTVQYYCKPSIKILKLHFDKFLLAQKYSKEAAGEMSSFFGDFQNILKNEGSDPLQESITRRYISCEKSNINSWRTALYRLLSESSQKYGDIFKISIPQ